jgi:hypothetical protein
MKRVTLWTIVTSRKTRHLLLLLVSFLLFAMFCGVPAWFIFSTFYLPDIQMHLAIKSYPSAKLLFETSRIAPADLDIETLFYWTQDSRDSVETYFTKTFQSTFVESGKVMPESKDNDYWVITSYQLNGVRPTLADANVNIYPPRTHGEVCEWWAPRFSDEFKCISISLVSADQPDLCQLPIISDEEPPYYQASPFARCAELPRTGTVLVYQYYLPGM